MIKTSLGFVEGNTIRLHGDIGVPPGQLVEVQIKVIEDAQPVGAGILRSAGALADQPQWGLIMEEIYQARRIQRAADIDLPE